jgi:hypothetical protein
MPDCLHQNLTDKHGGVCPDCGRDLKAPATEDSLRNEQGFPPQHTHAFREVARTEGCVILTRTPGSSCEGPLREGYAAKSFHIKAKSCNFGGMAGFLCLDPVMNKAGVQGAYSNLKENHKSLTVAYEGKTSGVVPLEISEERLQWLLGAGGKLRGARDSTGGYVLAAGQDKEKTVSVNYLLVKRDGRWAVYYDLGRIYGLPEGKAPTRELLDTAWKTFSAYLPAEVKEKPDDLHHAVEYFAELWDLLLSQAAVAPAPTQAIDGQVCAHYVPALAMTNPHRDYDEKGPEAYKNAVTGDYDLFAIWPRTFDRQEDARVAGMQAGMKDDDLIAREEKSAIGKVAGNISTRIYTIAQLLNSMMTPDARVQPNRVFHSDEAGRPFVKQVDEAAAFTPTGEMYMIKSAAELASFIRAWHEKGHVIFINKGWAAHLPEDVKGMVTWPTASPAPSPSP